MRLGSTSLQRAIYEDFFEPLKAILASIVDSALTADALLSAFNDQETSASIVVFLRLLTSAFLRANEADFAPFLLAFEEDFERFPAGAPSLHEFCQFCGHSNPCPDQLEANGVLPRRCGGRRS